MQSKASHYNHSAPSLKFILKVRDNKEVPRKSRSSTTSFTKASTSGSSMKSNNLFAPLQAQQAAQSLPPPPTTSSLDKQQQYEEEISAQQEQAPRSNYNTESESSSKDDIGDAGVVAASAGAAVPSLFSILNNNDNKNSSNQVEVGGGGVPSLFASLNNNNDGKNQNKNSNNVAADGVVPSLFSSINNNSNATSVVSQAPQQQQHPPKHHQHLHHSVNKFTMRNVGGGGSSSNNNSSNYNSSNNDSSNGSLNYNHNDDYERSFNNSLNNSGVIGIGGNIMKGTTLRNNRNYNSTNSKFAGAIALPKSSEALSSTHDLLEFDEEAFMEERGLNDGGKDENGGTAETAKMLFAGDLGDIDGSGRSDGTSTVIHRWCPFSLFSHMKLKYQIYAIKMHPYILWLPLSIFIVLVASGLLLVSSFTDTQLQAQYDMANELATDSGRYFSDQLDLAILPLFSMAQFVAEIPEFHDLPYGVGPAFEPGSLPFIVPDGYEEVVQGEQQQQSDGLEPDRGRGSPTSVTQPPKPTLPPVPLTHRNVTGSVCMDPTFLERFNAIAETIKRNSNMQGVLINVQLAPDAVVCAVHPVNNTEDFPEGIYMDNSGAIGHDLLTDPDRSFIVEATIPQEDVVIAGPITLKQCQDCDPTVEKAFIARLPISIPGSGFEMTVNGVSYESKWGFAVVLINWNELINRSSIQDSFEKEQFGFQLTRTDQIFDQDLNAYRGKVVVLADNDLYYHHVGDDGDDGGKRRKETYRSVSADLQTTNNEWVMTVTFDDRDHRFTVAILTAIAIVVSFCISMLVYTILVQKQISALLITEQSSQLVANAKQAAQRERELNDFLAHEVRNPLAAALSAVSFVSCAVTTKPSSKASKPSSFKRLSKIDMTGSVSSPGAGDEDEDEAEPFIVEPEDLENLQQDVGIIEYSLQFINDLLRNMLDLHRAHGNQLQLNAKPTDIKRDVLEPVASMLYKRNTNFAVIVDCPDDVFLSIDCLRVKQIILNLARNSTKFVERGFVRLRCDIVPPDDDINYYNGSEASGDGHVRIYVEDSGPGIPEDKKDKLFSKFQPSLDSLSQGTGIGLSLCQKLITLMNGELYHDDTYDSGVPGCPGARLVVDLKASPMSLDSIIEAENDDENSKAFQLGKKNIAGTGHSDVNVNGANPPSISGVSDGADVPPESAAANELPEKLRVLFVDDSLVLRKLFKRTIAKVRPDWDVEEAASGEAALQLVDSKLEGSADPAEGNKHFDLIFLDQYMASTDKALTGTETCLALRSKHNVKSAICGLSANNIKDGFLSAGANAFLVKPLPTNADELKGELYRILFETTFKE